MAYVSAPGALAATVPAELDLFTVIHGALRGRYLLVILLGLVGAVAGAALGWMIGTPQYSSEAVVGVQFGAPLMGEQSPDTERAAEQIRDFVQLQERLVESREALTLAMQDPQWLAVTKLRTFAGGAYDTPSDFATHIRVDTHTGMRNTLKISFSDPSPTVADAGASAVVRAYSTVYAKQEDAFQQHRAEVMEAHRQVLAAQLQGLEARIRKLDGDLVGDPSLVEVSRLRGMLTDARSSPQPSLNSASADPLLSSYMQSREQVQQQLEALRDAGYGERHPQVSRYEAALAAANDRLEQYRHRSGSRAIEPSDSDMTSPAGHAADGPDAALADENLRLRAAEADGKSLTLAHLRAQDEQLAADLAKLSTDIEALPLQSELRGRVTVVVDNEVPMHPLQDRRLIKASAAGCFGAMLPAATLVGLGTVRRRFRFAEEMQESLGGNPTAAGDPASGFAGRLTLLGAIPNLRPSDVDAHGGVSAAHAVNQLRVMLQLGRRRGQTNGSVYAIASASSGEGKTSVTAALGLAFAASGSRTLMIDFDLVGRVLTDSLDAAGEPGVCDAVAEGLLGTTAATGDELEVLEFIRPTPQPGLDLLPAGEEGLLHAGMLTHEAAAQLLVAVKDRYDVVLVDTGPVLGSVEAAVVTPEADAVVLVIARGQQQHLVEQAVDHLRAVGARVAGLVFNRADRAQFRHSSRSISQRLHRSSSGSHVASGRRELAEQLTRLGTLVRAVATFLPARTSRRALPASIASESTGTHDRHEAIN